MQPFFHPTIRHAAVILFAASYNLCLAQEAQPAAEVSFVERFQPIVSKNCSGCHTEGGHAGGLRLDDYASLLKGGDHGPAIVPGDPQASLVMKALRHEKVDQMPPAGKLSDADIRAIERWIKDVAHESNGAPAAVKPAPAPAPRGRP
jgi:mono/diheme cytochrome c family protein